MVKDTNQIKNKIVQFLTSRGPSLPSDISREIGMDMLFTSAFLSELISEKRILSSHIRIGSSAIYFLKEQNNQLEKFSNYVKGKEKEALNLLKEKKFLVDKEQEAPIQVALRQIKDFAFPFEKNTEVIWRYLTEKEEDFTQKEIKKQEIKIEEIPKQENPKEKIEIFDKKSKNKAVKKTRKNISQKKNEKFFNKVKELLNKKNIEISDIEGFSKKDLFLVIKENNQERLLAAFNKKRITEVDILKSYKKAKELNLNHEIFCLGDPAKKLDNFINAIKNLTKIEKIE